MLSGGGFARIYGSYISWRDPHTPVPKEIVPQLAFDRLFRGGGGAQQDSDNKSVLDVVLGDAKNLQSRVSGLDRVKLDEYFESVRSVERRLDAAAKPKARWVNEGKPPVDRPAPGIPASWARCSRCRAATIAGASACRPTGPCPRPACFPR